VSRLKSLKQIIVSWSNLQFSFRPPCGRPYSPAFIRVYARRLTGFSVGDPPVHHRIGTSRGPALKRAQHPTSSVLVLRSGPSAQCHIKSVQNYLILALIDVLLPCLRSEKHDKMLQIDVSFSPTLY